MILVDDVVKHLIDKLAEIYPKPAMWKGIAAKIAQAAPEWATVEHLDELAEKIIATRKGRTFPDPASLITLVKAIKEPDHSDGLRNPRFRGRREWIGGREMRFATGPAGALAREKALDEAELNALRFLHGTVIAERAVAEQWAPGLIAFAVANGCAPGFEEEEEIVALSRRIDVDCRDLVDAPEAVPPRRNAGKFFVRAGGIFGEAVRKFRAAMHETAARRLMEGARTQPEEHHGRDARTTP